jgi:hypothetical protein
MVVLVAIQLAIAAPCSTTTDIQDVLGGLIEVETGLREAARTATTPTPGLPSSTALEDKKH